MVELTIDVVSDPNEVAIVRDGRELGKACWDHQKNQTEKLIGQIEDLLLGAKISKNEISVIRVDNKKGSYTSVRIGMTVANCLGYALNIPVLTKNEDNLPSSDFVAPLLPIYENEPIITKPKARLK